MTKAISPQFTIYNLLYCPQHVVIEMLMIEITD